MDNLSERFMSAKFPAGSFGGVYSFRFMSIYEKGGGIVRNAKLGKIEEILKEIDSEYEEKADNLEWENQEKDQQKDEYYTAIMDVVLEIREKIEEMREIKLEDF